MDIEKAIEILTESVESTDFAPDPDFIDSIKLGIEALQFIHLSRHTTPATVPTLLHGETED